MSPRRPIPFTFQSAALFMVLANLPDIDFLLGYLVARDPHAFHQGPTHSLIFAVIVGFLAGFAWRKRFGLWPTSGVLIAAILSHDVIDLFTGPSPGFIRSPGLALLWPFDTAVTRAPVTIFPGVLHLTFDDLLSLHNVITVVYEVVVFVPIIALLYVCRARSVHNRIGRAG